MTLDGPGHQQTKRTHIGFSRHHIAGHKGYQQRNLDQQCIEDDKRHEIAIQDQRVGNVKAVGYAAQQQLCIRLPVELQSQLYDKDHGGDGPKRNIGAGTFENFKQLDL